MRRDIVFYGILREVFPRKGVAMQLHFEPITPDNRSVALTLAPAPGQEGFLEPVAQCLQEAAKHRFWRPVLIYAGPTPVGFAMYGRFWLESFPLGRVWLDRFLIDRRYQGRGLGRAALAGLLERLHREYPCRYIYLSLIEGNPAAALYQSMGFVFTGKRDPNGELIMVYSIPKEG